MRKLLLSMIAAVICLTAISQQVQVIPLSVEQNRLELKSVTPESFSAKVQMKELKIESRSTENGDFSILNVEGFVRPSNVGKPNLPVLSKLIEVPYGADIQILIKGYTEEVINLDEYGISRIEPAQPSYHKSTPIEDQVFVIDEDFYNTDEYDTDELIKAEISGEMRGVRIGRIEIRPYRYNPVENTLVVYNNLDFEVVFVNADLALTSEMKNKYYTPEFEGSYATILNYQAPAAKDAFSNYAAPIKYVIVANTAFESTLQPFVEWKTKQGYNVIEYYVASGTANTTIKTYLQNLYTAGTASDPAPLYVMIIGDHSGTYSIPGFTSTVSGNSHVTDLYFATYGGASDYLPDLYYGRISAESTTELSNALNKILPYEQYTLPDFDYLNSCLLVAGTDASWAHKAGDATILYATNNYFNVAHGFSNIYAYYYNYPSGPYWVMSSNSTAADADVNAKIAGGVGFGNYTAHCDHDGWSDPAVRRTNIANWNNINEYPFLIGNCCLSFEYNQSDAFGEMLLYAANEGAVGYIGTTNFSYWYEDVYWGIGLTTEATVDAANITAYNYSNTGLGVYDGIFHENGEAYSNWYYTARQIVHKGNLAVESSSETSLKKYYWEIYHCVGDPSLMPYMTEPDPLSLSFSNPMQGATSLTVTTEPYTYVAISKNNTLLDAEWSGSGTSVTLTVPAFTGDAYCVVGTKQDRSPYINESVVPTAANPPVADFSGTPTTILEGQSVTFTDASQYPASWSWNFGDSQTSTEQNPVHTYTTAGTYTVSLTVTNGLGNDTEIKLNYITVNPNTNPPTTDFVADATSINIGATVNFTDLSINNPSSWAWTFEGGTPATSSNQNPSVTYNTAGVYQVSLTATNAFGGTTETKLAYINVVSCSSYCASEGNMDYETSVTQVVFNTISNTSAKPAVYNDYTSIQTDVYRDDTYSMSVKLNTDGNYTIHSLAWIDWNHDCDFDDAGETYDLGTAKNVTNGLTTLSPLSITVPADAMLGLTRMRVSAQYNADPTSCGVDFDGEVEDYTVNVLAPLVAPVCDFTADQNSGCGTLTVQFTDNSTNSPTSWLWNFGDTQTSTSQNPSHTYSTPGTYTVSLTATNSVGSDLETKTDYVVVNALPTAVSVAGGGTQCGGSMTLTATNGGSGTIYYQGTTSGGTSTATASASQTVSTSGTYYFRARSAEGCWGPEGSATVTINPLPSDVTVLGGGTFCGGTATLTATGGTGGTIYWQNTTNNGTSTATASASQTVSSTGTYYFRAQSAQGCWGNQGSTVVTINALPTAVSVAGGGTQCGGSMTLTATNGGSGTIYYQGTTSGGTSTATASASQTVSTSGTYYFRARSAEGCWGPEGSATVTINPLPSDVTVSGGGTFCGGTATLTATGGTGGTIYWQNTTNNGTSTATASASQTVSTTGTYYFRSQSAQGCWGNQGSAVVTINPVVDITLNATDESAPGANDGTVTVSVNSGTPSYDYTWSVAGTTASLTGLAGGSYCVTVSDANGCEDYGCATVNTLGAPPVADFVSDVVNGCDNLTVSFTDLTANNPISWAWDFGDGNASTIQNPTNVYDAPGIYTVTLSVTNANGADDVTVADMIIVGETPTLVMSMTEETQTPGMDGTASVVVTGGLAPYSYEWTGGYSTDEITGLEADTYCVTVIESNGCEASDCIIVTQEEPLNPPVADFEADVTMGCENLTVQFTDLSTNNPTTWAWDFGDGYSSVEQNPVHTYTTSGLFTVTLTVTNTDGSDVIEMADMIFVGTAPVVSVDVVQASGELVADGSAEVVIVGGTAPYDILWSNDETTNSIANLLPGNYSVMVVDAAGCIVTEPFTVSWTNSIDNSTISMSIFPNPASDYVTVDMEGAIADYISITNALGQIVIEFNPTSNTSIINFAGVEPGVYFINITADGKVFNNKIVVRK